MPREVDAVGDERVERRRLDVGGRVVVPRDVRPALFVYPCVSYEQLKLVSMGED